MALKLIPNPTFKAKVLIPIAGGKPEPVEFTFKHLGEKARIERDEAANAKLADIRKELGIPDTQDEISAMVEAGALTAEDLNKYTAALRAVRPEQVMSIATGWDLADKFDEENLALMFDSYQGAFEAIWDTFREQLGVARTKN